MIQTAVMTRARTAIQRRAALWDRLFAAVPIVPLVIFRVAFGMIMLWEVWRYFTYGWIERYYIRPGFYFSYYGFDWIKSWGGDGMYLHFYALGFLAIMIALGFCYRISAILFFLGFSYVFLLDEARYLNHFYLISLISFLLIFVPAHRFLSLDAWIRPRIESKVVPAWALWLLRFQIGIVYFYGGIAKINADWLRGEPLREWLASSTDFPLIGQYFTQEWLVYTFAYGGLLFDLLFVPLVFHRRTRPLILLVSLFFHVSNHYLFNIGIFPWFMLAANVLFLPISLWGKPDPLLNPPPPAGEGRVRVFSLQRMLIYFLAIYCLFQLLFPLRHFLYPGEVHWTEEGHRFSWHMKLRDKEGAVEFWVIDWDTGTSQVIDPRDYLLRHQIDAMKTRPDMLLEFSHFIAEMMRYEGIAEPDVRVRALVSLNSREPQLMIDPGVNLAKVERSWRRSDWILQLEEE